MPSKGIYRQTSKVAMNVLSKTLTAMPPVNGHCLFFLTVLIRKYLC